MSKYLKMSESFERKLDNSVWFIYYILEKRLISEDDFETYEEIISEIYYEFAKLKPVKPRLRFGLSHEQFLREEFIWDEYEKFLDFLNSDKNKSNFYFNGFQFVYSDFKKIDGVYNYRLESEIEDMLDLLKNWKKWIGEHE